MSFVPDDNMSDKQISRALKKIESSIIMNFYSEIIPEERNNRNKSSYVWFSEDSNKEEQVKLEIGSCVKPHPHSRKTLKSYIHEYLEAEGFIKEIEEYGLKQVEIEVLDITRTFIDKTILYTETKQEFDNAIAVFEHINIRLKELDE